MFHKFFKSAQKSQGDGAMALRDLVVIVTGSGRGLGLSIAQHLASQGAKVICVSRNNIELRKALQGELKRHLIFDADITNESEVERLLGAIKKKFNTVDVLVNNAGVNVHGAVDVMSVENFDKMLQTNVKGTFLMTKHIVPIMKKNKKGLIVNVGSKISRNTFVQPNKSIYAMTKYAIEGFSFALNRELRQFGIRVVCLMPGTINTFFSLKSGDFLQASDIADFLAYIISHDNIDFESVVMKSVKQNI